MTISMRDGYFKHYLYFEYTLHWTASTVFHARLRQVPPSHYGVRKSAVGNVMQVEVSMHNTVSEIADLARWRMMEIIKLRNEYAVICTAVDWLPPIELETTNGDS